MNVYRQFIFPRLLDWTMSDAVLDGYRQDILMDVSGEVLEIGFGTGLNLPFYPPDITQISAIDANPGMKSIVEKRIASSGIAVKFQTLNGENLPMADNSFDSVVSTWTLCSIANLDRALSEIDRVLKPEGRFFFIEHGLSNEPQIQTWQNRLNPIQKFVGDGCHLNRNIGDWIASRFAIVRLEQFYLPDLPKHIGYTYKGVAAKR